MTSTAGPRPHLICGQCQALIAWPAGISPGDKARIAAAARRDPVAAARMVESKYGFDEREGRALAVHVTRKAGICHRCGSAVAGAEVQCPKCRAANLNW